MIACGRVMMEEGQLHAVQGVGRFIPTPCYADYVYGRINAREAVSDFWHKMEMYIKY